MHFLSFYSSISSFIDFCVLIYFTFILSIYIYLFLHFSQILIAVVNQSLIYSFIFQLCSFVLQYIQHSFTYFLNFYIFLVIAIFFYIYLYLYVYLPLSYSFAHLFIIIFIVLSLFNQLVFSFIYKLIYFSYFCFNLYIYLFTHVVIDLLIYF